MSANPHRGEIAVTLDGREFVLRPDFEAAAAIDTALGSVVEVARRGVADPAALSLQELSVILTEGIKASGRAAKSDDAHVGVQKVKRLIFEAGVPSVIGPVMQFLALAITGGAKPDATGNE